MHPSCRSQDFLNTLELMIACCNRAYELYNSNERKFFFAKALMVQNERLLDHILRHGHIVPAVHREQLAELVTHIDAWRISWNIHATQHAPDSDDEFVYETRVPFPHDAVRALLAYRDELVSSQGKEATDH